MQHIHIEIECHLCQLIIYSKPELILIYNDYPRGIQIKRFKIDIYQIQGYN